MMLFFMLSAHFFDTKDEGWHFYHDRARMPVQEKKTAPKAASQSEPQSLKELKAKAEALLEEAVWSPTLQNIGRYQRIQKHIMEKSERFALLWAENLLLEPDLDSTVEEPTSYYGILAQKEDKAKQHLQSLEHIAQNYALVLLINDTYMSKQLFMVVKAMAAERKIPIVTVDARFDPDAQKTQWKIKRIPALLMVERANGNTSVVTYGLQAQDALEQRLIDVMSHKLRRLQS